MLTFALLQRLYKYVNRFIVWKKHNFTGHKSHIPLYPPAKLRLISLSSQASESVLSAVFEGYLS